MTRLPDSSAGVMSRVRGDNSNPARPTCPRISTLRISHFPDPRTRRYNRPQGPRRARSQRAFEQLLDIRADRSDAGRRHLPVLALPADSDEHHLDVTERAEAGDIEAEHVIYAEDAILDYPQSGEQFRGRARISAQRGGHPADRHFTVARITGGGNLWVSECLITYDGAPSYSVSIMELIDGLVARETQYFADPFQAPKSRRALSEQIAP